MAIPESITRKVAAGERLTPAEGVALLREGDLLELAGLADSVRERLHPEGVVTYIVDRNINYTNVCTAQSMTVHELVRLIREAGRRPLERDTVFNVVKEW